MVLKDREAGLHTYTSFLFFPYLTVTFLCPPPLLWPTTLPMVSFFFFPSVFSLHSWSLNVSKGCCAAAGEVAKPQSLSDRAPLTGALSHWLGKVCPASDGHVHGPPPYVSTQASGLRGSENVDVVGLSGSVASSEEEKCLPLPIVDREFCG